MRADVISAFTDLKSADGHVYRPGDEFEGSAARVADLSRQGFVTVRDGATKTRRQTRRGEGGEG